MKKLLLATVAALVFLVAGSAVFMMNTTAGQDLLLSRVLAAAVGATDEQTDSLRVFVCGSAAPLPTEGRAQACLAVLTPEHYLVVDAGSGSANNLGLSGLPAQRLDGVLLTHFHSDHISDLPAVNVVSWAGGRKGPLRVYGPPGVARVVNGFNEAFAQDRMYRTMHHGRTFMPKAFGRLEAIEQPVESSLSLGDLTIQSFVVQHSPVEPAVGYRFEYKGRSVVITGDTIVTDRLREMVAGADLLVSEALSLPLVEAIKAAADHSGRSRAAKILFDIQDYHASVKDVADLTRSTDVDMTALYHLAPAPRNRLMENIFKREFTDNMVLTEDRMWFELPVGSTEIRIRHE